MLFVKKVFLDYHLFSLIDKSEYHGDACEKISCRNGQLT